MLGGAHTTALAVADIATVPPPVVMPAGSTDPANHAVSLVPPEVVKAELVTTGLAVGLPTPTITISIGFSWAKSMLLRVPKNGIA
jgi:hypothetical protein